METEPNTQDVSSLSYILNSMKGFFPRESEQWAALDKAARELQQAQSRDCDIVAHDGKAFSPAQQDAMYPPVQQAQVVGEHHLPVHVSCIRDLEVIGKQCLDSGTCHHGCTKVCARRTGCVPLSIAETYLNDNWTLKTPPQSSAPVVGELWRKTGDSLDGYHGDIVQRHESGLHRISHSNQVDPNAVWRGHTGRTQTAPEQSLEGGWVAWLPLSESALTGRGNA